MKANNKRLMIHLKVTPLKISPLKINPLEKSKIYNQTNLNQLRKKADLIKTIRS
jgi:hypothetical protein